MRSHIARGNCSSFQVALEAGYKAGCRDCYPSSHPLRVVLSAAALLLNSCRMHSIVDGEPLSPAGSVNVFGQQILSEWRPQHVDENLIFSPLSIAMCFFLIYNGARGETKAELENLFEFDVCWLLRTCDLADESCLG